MRWSGESVLVAIVSISLNIGILLQCCIHILFHVSQFVEKIFEGFPVGITTFRAIPIDCLIHPMVQNHLHLSVLALFGTISASSFSQSSKISVSVDLTGSISTDVSLRRPILRKTQLPVFQLVPRLRECQTKIQVTLTICP